MVRVARTVAVRSVKLSKKEFRVFVEVESMYRNMVEQLAMYAVGNGVKSFIRLKALRYREMRNLYPHLPSHYAYTACQDAFTRAKSFMKLKRHGLAEKECPDVRRVSIWLDDHLWRLDGYTSIRMATHGGWISVDLELHKQYWRYINKGWRLASEARIKLDKKNRRLIVYLMFYRDVREAKSRGYLPVDINENNVTVLIDSAAYLFETGVEKTVLGYHYRRKKIQENDRHGVNSRAKRMASRKLKERKKKQDVRWKLANIIVGVAYGKQYAVVLEDLGRKPANNMVERVKDKQLRHRIFQASFKGIQKAIEEKAREYGVPVVYVNPKNTSKLCPVHKTLIHYDNIKIGRCCMGNELWHRDVVACWNLLMRACLGNGSHAPSLGGLSLDGSPVPLGSTATHEPIGIPKSLWARWKSLLQVHF